MAPCSDFVNTLNRTSGEEYLCVFVWKITSYYERENVEKYLVIFFDPENKIKKVFFYVFMV